MSSNGKASAVMLEPYRFALSRSDQRCPMVFPAGTLILPAPQASRQARLFGAGRLAHELK